MAEMRPSASMTNVLRSAPMYFLPYMLFSTQTPYGFDDLVVGIGQEREGQLIFADELLVALRRIDAHAEDLAAFFKIAPRIAQPQAWSVQPGVSSFG